MTDTTHNLKYPSYTKMTKYHLNYFFVVEEIPFKLCNSVYVVSLHKLSKLSLRVCMYKSVHAHPT